MLMKHLDQRITVDKFWLNEFMFLCLLYHCLMYILFINLMKTKLEPTLEQIKQLAERNKVMNVLLYDV